MLAMVDWRPKIDQNEHVWELILRGFKILLHDLLDKLCHPQTNSKQYPLGM